jgi:hypothetical protein
MKRPRVASPEAGELSGAQPTLAEPLVASAGPHPERIMQDISRYLQVAADDPLGQEDFVPQPLAPETVAFLLEQERTPDPAGLLIVLDAFARASEEFHGVVPIGGDSEDVELVMEDAVLQATDERVAELSRVLFDHEAAGPLFFR